MSSIHRGQLTGLLQAWDNGDKTALEKLLPLVGSVLRQRAQIYLRKERRDHTLQPTALVNEVYLRLVQFQTRHWKDSAHFMHVVAKMMRQILVDHARSHLYAKRRGEVIQISGVEDRIASPDKSPDLVALDEALNRLKMLNPRQSEVVELRFFGGLTLEETAKVLGVAPMTVKRDWSIAKAWLYHELNNGGWSP